MNNRLLINVNVPAIEASYNLFIPNNKKIGTIKKYILRVISELSENNFVESMDSVLFIDRDTGKEFSNDVLVKDTEIKNGTKIVII